MREYEKWGRRKVYIEVDERGRGGKGEIIDEGRRDEILGIQEKDKGIQGIGGKRKRIFLKIISLYQYVNT